MINNGDKEKKDIKISVKFGAWVAGRVTMLLEKLEVRWKSKVLCRHRFI